MQQSEFITNTEFKELVDLTRSGFANIGRRFDAVEARLTSLEGRFDELDEYHGRRDEEFRLEFEGINAKLEQIWNKLDELDS